MPGRFQNNQRKWVYLFLSVRDGEHCLICYSKPNNKTKLEIDHADSNPANMQPQNLHLLCRKCNQAMRLKSPKVHARIISDCYAKNVRECVRERMNSNKIIFEYEAGSSEMKANSYYESKYRDWLLNNIMNLGFITKKEAINSGAEFVGCSPITTARYLDKLTSFEGILETREESNQTIILLKTSK